MRTFSKLILALVTIALLLQQSTSFAFEQWHQAGAAGTALPADQNDTPVRDQGKRDSGSHCSHGCHLQNHFVGHIAHAQSEFFGPLKFWVLTVPPLDDFVTANVEPPYRPPRFFSLI